MLQMVKWNFVVVVSIVMCSCNKFELKGLVMPTGDGVNERFEQSMQMSEGLHAGTIDAQEDYTFYVATDPHINDTHHNLSIFNDALKNDCEALFGVILGDCIDIKDNLLSYLDALAYDASKHSYDQRLFHVLGNHDVYFNGWEDFKKWIGSSVYWFETLFAEGKDLFITLDTATGTL